MNVPDPAPGYSTRMRPIHTCWHGVDLPSGLTLPADAAPRLGFKNMTTAGGPVSTS